MAAAETRAFGAEPLRRRIPGEFEPQEAVCIGWTESDPIIRHVLIEIVKNVSAHVPVMILVDDAKERRAATLALRASGVKDRSIHLLMIPGDTIWIRDFGPLTVYRSDGQSELINHKYAAGQRPWDDQAPSRLAGMLRMPLRNIRLTMEGGNLLSNGKGVVITTSRIIQQNSSRGVRGLQLQDQFRRELGATGVVILEPLSGEPTGHVDMFTAFIDASTVVVAQLNPRVDRRNAELLDRNADRLRRTMTSMGPLRVVRVPMPAPREDVWRTYTNLLFAGPVVLVPVYSGVDRDGRERALEIYRRLMPEREIIAVDCSELIRLGGALHCITMNVGQVGNRRPAARPR